MKQLVIILTVIILSAVNSFSQPYEIPFGSKGNIVELAVNNQTKDVLAKVNVSVEKAPEWISFDANNKELLNIESSKGNTVNFSFGVDKNAPVKEESEIIFKVEDSRGRVSYKTIKVLVSNPVKFELSQNYPNPFNPSTKITFTLPEDARVSLSVYNILGEKVTEVINSDEKAGYHQVDFNGNTLASGMYIYRISAGSYSSVKKMLLLK